MNPNDHRPDHPGGSEPVEEQSDRSVDDPVIPALGATLKAALAPENDVRDQARHKVDRALNARSAAAGLSSMGSCAIDTVRHLLTNPSRGADRYSMADVRLTADSPTAHTPTSDTQQQEVDHD